MKQGAELHQLLAFRDKMFPILHCSQSKFSILMSLFLKQTLQEVIPPYFAIQHELYFFHAPREHICEIRFFKGDFRKSRNLSDFGNDNRNINCITIHR